MEVKNIYFNCDMTINFDINQLNHDLALSKKYHSTLDNQYKEHMTAIRQYLYDQTSEFIDNIINIIVFDHMKFNIETNNYSYNFKITDESDFNFDRVNGNHGQSHYYNITCDEDVIETQFIIDSIDIGDLVSMLSKLSSLNNRKNAVASLINDIKFYIKSSDKIKQWNESSKK